MSHPSSVDGPAPPPSWDPPAWDPPAWTPPRPGTAAGAWTPWGTWDPAAGRAVPAPVPARAPAPAGGGRPLLVVLAATAIGATGLVLASVLGALVLTTAADDVGEAIGEGVASSMEETLGGGYLDPYAYDPYATGGALGPVEQSEPVPPGELGPDPVLDAYAQQCFDGDLQSCDDLFAESPPLSDYETYALTCGGRVKEYEVPYCTDLD